MAFYRKHYVPFKSRGDFLYVICSFLLLHIHISVENIGVKIRSNSDYQLDSFTDPHLFHSSLPVCHFSGIHGDAIKSCPEFHRKLFTSWAINGLYIRYIAYSNMQES
ncbi:hypothetical protein T05_13099 [Trichinella murrelli]|uniref:Uncharacterized protein n=1 Tax=Trichinella murrelli TaxID=144512 RepID=A0A0V0T7U4_9BILA|nr:hypothetical protein T05_13099 [Trichinella murrelli]